MVTLRTRWFFDSSIARRPSPAVPAAPCSMRPTGKLSRFITPATQRWIGLTDWRENGRRTRVSGFSRSLRPRADRDSLTRRKHCTNQTTAPRLSTPLLDQISLLKGDNFCRGDDRAALPFPEVEEPT